MLSLPLEKDLREVDCWRGNARLGDFTLLVMLAVHLGLLAVVLEDPFRTEAPRHPPSQVGSLRSHDTRVLPPSSQACPVSEYQDHAIVHPRPPDCHVVNPTHGSLGLAMWPAGVYQYAAEAMHEL